MSISGILYIIAYTLLAQYTCGLLYGDLHPNNYGYTATSSVIHYIFHTALLSWNEARQVCENNGGTLAKIESRALGSAIYNAARKKYNTNIFAGYDYYLALIRTEDDEYVWTSDCSLLQNNDTYYIPGADRECIRIKKDTFKPEDHDCHHERAFLCQQTTNLDCDEGMVFNSSFLYYPNINSSVCSELCKQDTYCWSSVRFPVDMCIKLMLSGYGNDGLQMATKNCIMVTLNETIPVNYEENTSGSPEHDCEPPYNVSVQSAIASPPSSVYPAPVGCNEQPQTVNVSVLIPVTVSSTLVQPTTVVVPTTVIQPTTVVVPTTVIQPTTVVVPTTVIQATTVTVPSTVVQSNTVTLSSTLVQPTTVTVPTTVIQPTTVEISSVVTASITTTELSTVMVPATVTDILTQFQTVTMTKTLSFNITRNLTVDEIKEAESVAAEIVKNLTINTKTTSSYTRSLTSADDKRTSAAFVGYVGTVFVVAPAVLIFLVDIRRLVSDFLNPQNMYKRKP